MPMTPQQALADAQEKYHALMTGTMATVVVDQNGERVEFNKANRAELYAYIQSLTAQTTPVDQQPFRGPVGFIF